MTENYVIVLNQEIPMPRNIKTEETKKEYKEYLREYASKYYPEREKEEFSDKTSYTSYLIEYSFELDFLTKKLYRCANNFYKKDKWYKKLKNKFLNFITKDEEEYYFDEEDEVFEESLISQEEIDELEEKIISQVEEPEVKEEVKIEEDKKENIFTKTVSFFKNIFNRKNELTEEELEENINTDETEELDVETMDVREMFDEVSDKMIQYNGMLIETNTSLMKNLKIQEETIKRLEKEVLNLKLKVYGYNPNNIMINHAYDEAKKEDEQRRIKSIIEKADISDFELRMGSLEASPGVYQDMNKVYVKCK